MPNETAPARGIYNSAPKWPTIDGVDRTRSKIIDYLQAEQVLIDPATPQRTIQLSRISGEVVSLNLMTPYFVADRIARSSAMAFARHFSAAEMQLLRDSIHAFQQDTLRVVAAESEKIAKKREEEANTEEEKGAVIECWNPKCGEECPIESRYCSQCGFFLRRKT